MPTRMVRAGEGTADTEGVLLKEGGAEVFLLADELPFLFAARFSQVELPASFGTVADIIVPATRGVQQDGTADKWAPKRAEYEFCGMAIASPDLYPP